MSDFLKVIFARPVEPVIGIIMLVVGGYGASTLDEAGTRTWATIIAALGGVLVSWATGTAYSRQQALNEIDGRLLTLSTQLGTETSNIELAVEQAQRGTITSETCFALLSQSLNSLTNIVNQIQSQLGASFNPQGWIETREKIAELTRTISKDKPATLSELNNIRTKLESINASLSAPRRGLRRGGIAPQLMEVTAPCPYCGKGQAVELGSQPGATAQGSCGSCGKRFNIHRSSSGAAFTRPLGRQILGGPLEDVMTDHADPALINCTECEATISVRVRSGQESQKVVCVQCGTGFLLSTKSLEVNKINTLKIVSGEAFGIYNSRPVTQCPSCHRRRTAVIRAESSYFAICDDCDTLIKVTEDDYRAVKDSADSRPHVNITVLPEQN